jgi:hypothetical protein
VFLLNRCGNNLFTIIQLLMGFQSKLGSLVESLSVSMSHQQFRKHQVIHLHANGELCCNLFDCFDGFLLGAVGHGQR